MFLWQNPWRQLHTTIASVHALATVAQHRQDHFYLYCVAQREQGKWCLRGMAIIVLS
jgi:hypothetical protein